MKIYIHIYIMDYYPVIKKDWNLAICDNMMDLEGIMPSEICQTNTAWSLLNHESNKTTTKNPKKWPRRDWIDGSSGGRVGEVT